MEVRRKGRCIIAPDDVAPGPRLIMTKSWKNWDGFLIDYVLIIRIDTNHAGPVFRRFAYRFRVSRDIWRREGGGGIEAVAYR